MNYQQTIKGDSMTNSNNKKNDKYDKNSNKIRDILKIFIYFFDLYLKFIFI